MYAITFINEGQSTTVYTENSIFVAEFAKKMMQKGIEVSVTVEWRY